MSKEQNPQQQEETDPKANQFKAADGPPPPHEETETAIHGFGDDAQDANAEEPRFAGKPLSSYDGMEEADLVKQDGVGEATAKRILTARRRRDRAAKK